MRVMTHKGILSAALTFTKTAFFRFSGSLLAAGGSIALAKGLSAQDFGLVSYAVTVVTVAANFCSLGGNISLIKQVSRLSREMSFALLKGYRNFILTMVGLASLGAVIVGSLALEYTPGLSVNWRFIAEHRIVLGIAIVAATYHSLVVAIYLGLKRSSQALFHEGVIRNVLFLLGILPLLFTGTQITKEFALQVFSISFFLALLVAIWGVKGTALIPALSVPTSSQYRISLWLCSQAILTSGNLVRIGNQKSFLLLSGILLAPTEVGLLALALRFGKLAGMGLSVVNLMVAPLIAETHDTDNRTRDLYALGAAWVGVLVSTVTLLFFWGVGKPIMAWLGPDYIAAYPLLLIILLGQLLSSAFGIVGMALNMTGGEGWALVAEVLTLAIAIPLGILLMRNYGASGAAWGYAATRIALHSILFSFTLWKSRLNPSILNFKGLRHITQLLKQE